MSQITQSTTNIWKSCIVASKMVSMD